jgi:hypothetical protein
VRVAGRGTVVLQAVPAVAEPEERETPLAADVPEMPPAIPSNGGDNYGTVAG